MLCKVIKLRSATIYVNFCTKHYFLFSRNMTTVSKGNNDQFDLLFRTITKNTHLDKLDDEVNVHPHWVLLENKLNKLGSSKAPEKWISVSIKKLINFVEFSSLS